MTLFIIPALSLNRCKQSSTHHLYIFHTKQHRVTSPLFTIAIEPLAITLYSEVHFTGVLRPGDVNSPDMQRVSCFIFPLGSLPYVCPVCMTDSQIKEVPVSITEQLAWLQSINCFTSSLQPAVVSTWVHSHHQFCQKSVYSEYSDSAKDWVWNAGRKSGRGGTTSIVKMVTKEAAKCQAVVVNT